MGDDAMMVTYGAMSKEPIQVGNMLFIYQTAWLTGFNRSKWVEEAHPEEVRLAYQDVFNLIEKKSIEVDVEEVYPFSRVVDAIRHANRPSRMGKVLLSF
jgi:trans-2-enoyl-CoA reductase